MKHYNFLEEAKHSKLWKMIYGRGELDKLRGARKIASSMNNIHGTDGTTRFVRSSEVVKGPVKRVATWWGDPRSNYTGLYTRTMTAKPSKSLLKKVGRGKKDAYDVIKSTEKYADI